MKKTQVDFDPDLLKNELIDFAQELVRCQSWNPPGNEADAAKRVATELDRLGLETKLMAVAPGRDNVIGRLRGTGEVGTLLLVGHLDTVPPGSSDWQRNPLSGEVDGGRIYGRGSADMKGGLAAAVHAAGALRRSGSQLAGDLVIAGTVGEEVDCLGAEALLRAGLLEDVTAIIIPEPTGLQLFTAHKGALWVRITTRGRAAHGARPDLGVNAILHMQTTIERLLAIEWEYSGHPLLGLPTVNIATIQGGTKTNMVPDLCELSIDYRTVPGQAHDNIVHKLQDVLGELAAAIPDYRAAMVVSNDKAAVETQIGHPLVKLAQEVGLDLWGRELTPSGVTYYTDASVLAAKTGLPVVILGPGEPEQAHQTDEWVSVDNIVESAQFYARLAARYLSKIR